MSLSAQVGDDISNDQVVEGTLVITLGPNEVTLSKRCDDWFYGRLAGWATVAESLPGNICRVKRITG